MASIQCGRCSGTHESVAEVRACHGLGEPAKKIERPGSERIYLEVDFSQKEAAKEDGARWDPDLRSWWITRERYTKKVADRWPAKDIRKDGRTMSVGDGFYDHEGEIYRVVHAVHRSGFPYAQKLHHVEDRFGRPKGSWQRAVGMQFQLRPEELITDERLRALGKLYGFCVKCGLPLTDPESIARGMGPICSGKGME